MSSDAQTELQKSHLVLKPRTAKDPSAVFHATTEMNKKFLFHNKMFQAYFKNECGNSEVQQPDCLVLAITPNFYKLVHNTVLKTPTYNVTSPYLPLNM